MDYMALRHFHMGCAAASITLFTLRGGLELAAVNWRRWALLRLVPHVIDSALLIAGISLAVISHQYPGQQAWLTAKIVGLVAYILLGKRALAPATLRAQRPLWFIGALLSVTYIVGVAMTRSPSWRLF